MMSDDNTSTFSSRPNTSTDTGSLALSLGPILSPAPSSAPISTPTPTLTPTLAPAPARAQIPFRSGTLSAMWGKSPSASTITSTSTAPSPTPSTSTLTLDPSAPLTSNLVGCGTSGSGLVKRRRKKDETGQAKLVRNEQGWRLDKETAFKKELASTQNGNGLGRATEEEMREGGDVVWEGKKKRGRPRKKKVGIEIDLDQVSTESCIEFGQDNGFDIGPGSGFREKPALSPEIINLVSSDAIESDTIHHQSQQQRKRHLRLMPTTNSSTRPAHPFFSKPNPRIASQIATSDLSDGVDPRPMDVDIQQSRKYLNQSGPSSSPQQTPKGPKKIVFANDNTKPTHSFFSKPLPASTNLADNTASPPPTSTTFSLGKTNVKVNTNGKLDGGVHSFFNMNGQQVSDRVGEKVIVRDGWGVGKEVVDAVWPGGDWPIHEGFVAGWEQGCESRVGRRERIKGTKSSEQDDFWRLILNQYQRTSLRLGHSFTPNDTLVNSTNESTATINKQHLEHPAIASVPHKARALAHGKETWCEVFRPRRASECLGNETEATYLRDWLRALQVGSQGGSRIIRRVSKHRRTVNPDTSWIVDDTGIFGVSGHGEDRYKDDDGDDFEDWLQNQNQDESGETIHFAFGQRPKSYPDLNRKRGIANTILLSGPGGSGKSAAVYAAADELGWDVFEVYTGTGKRTGGNLVALVGDVGKNHMVNKGRTAGVGGAATGTCGGGRVSEICKEENEMQGKGGHGRERTNGMGSLTLFFKAAESGNKVLKPKSTKSFQKNGTKTNVITSTKATPKSTPVASQGSVDDPIDVLDEDIESGDETKRGSYCARPVIVDDDDEADEEDSDGGDFQVVENGIWVEACSKDMVVVDDNEEGELNDELDEDRNMENFEGSTSTEQIKDDKKIEKDGQHEPRQSLILIDEADILFEDESTFWPTVISIIAESKRPIILTCNDINRIPVSSLPLQTILRFLPPDEELATAYLDAIHSACATILNQGKVGDGMKLYSTSVHGHDDEVMLDQPLPPNGNEPQKVFDLRRAITQLQLDRGKGIVLNSMDDMKNVTALLETSEENNSVEEMKREVRRLNLRSFTDAHVGPRSWARMDTFELDRFGPGSDDEDGIHQLVKPDIHHWVAAVPAYDGSREIADELLRLGGGLTGDKTGPLVFAQSSHVRSLLPLLDELVPLSSYLLPHQSLFLELVPTVTNIIELDDTLEAAERAAIAAGGKVVNRRTGRPIRITSFMQNSLSGDGGGYERWIQVGEEGLKVARKVRKDLQVW